MFKSSYTHRRKSSAASDDIDPYSDADVYYGPKTDPSQAKRHTQLGRTRTLSTSIGALGLSSFKKDFQAQPYRRASIDPTVKNRRFFIADIDGTLHRLLESEDTDSNCQITIEDTGPKVLRLGTANSRGINQEEIRGTYMLSNLLQELTIAKRFGRNQMVLDEARLSENPVKRLKRLLSNQFWNNLSRRLDDSNIGSMAQDTKINTPGAKVPRIYIPHDEKDQYEYYRRVAESNPQINLDVEYLPADITPQYVQSINDRPGLLALAMQKKKDPKTGEMTFKGFPYVVPGGRFNELYGWDSYMCSLGLLEDDRIELVEGMVENFIFEIYHYGKILNANRSYYLCRSQPPFLTDMSLRLYKEMAVLNRDGAHDLLYRATQAAIKEYKTIWTASPRLDKITGLSCYHPDGLGIPSETEASHFISVLEPYAKKRNVSLAEFQEKYNSGEFQEPGLDAYFVHDRAVRESGHDTSYRLEGKCADLATIDLNSLLYKYEVDIAFIIREHFDNQFADFAGNLQNAEEWEKRAAKRKVAINKYCWSEKDSIYYDYDVRQQCQSDYETATCFWAMWAGVASEEQAAKMITISLPKLEELGGLASGTLKSRGDIGLDRPSRQWDYPFGWAPQQMLAWVGLEEYGYHGIARRLCYRWLYMITKAFVDFNGIVVEKYDVTRSTDPHKVDAEYGNQGSDFRGVATEGFGWVNSSYIFGLTFMDMLSIRALGACTPPDVFFKSLRQDERATFGL